MVNTKSVTLFTFVVLISEIPGDAAADQDKSHHERKD